MDNTAQKGLYLDGTSISLPDGAMTFLNNFEIDSNYITYVNADGFAYKLKLTDNSAVKDGINLNTILGKIELPNGIILFGITTGNISVIVYLDYDDASDKLILKKRITMASLKFDLTKTITGTYTYNYKKEILIVFSDGVDSTYEIMHMNIHTVGLEDNPNAASIINVSLTTSNLLTCTISPNCIFPDIFLESVSIGSIPKGTYQVAVRYSLNNHFTGFSVLSQPVNIANTNTDTSDISNPSNKALDVNCMNSDNRFKFYDIAVIKTDQDGQSAYIIKNISTSRTYTCVSTLHNLESIPIEEILIRPVPILNGETFAVNRGSLLIGNLKYQDSKRIDDIMTNAIQSSKCKVSYAPAGNTHFQAYEYYIMYVGALDNKGQLINTYLLNNLQSDVPGLVIDRVTIGEPDANGIWDTMGCIIRPLDPMYEYPTIFNENIFPPIIKPDNDWIENPITLEDHNFNNNWLKYEKEISVRDYGIGIHASLNNTASAPRNMPPPPVRNTANNDQTELISESMYDDKYNNVKIDLKPIMTSIIANDPDKMIESIVLLYAEHNESNSVVLSEALFIRDGYRYINDTPTGQFAHPFKIRLYPFEHLFNIRDSISCRISVASWSGDHAYGSPTEGQFFKEQVEDDGEIHKQDPIGRFRSGFHGIANNAHIERHYLNEWDPSGIVTLKYTYPLNEQLDNLQGDSYYRLDGSIGNNMSAFTEEHPIGRYPLSDSKSRSVKEHFGNSIMNDIYGSKHNLFPHFGKNTEDLNKTLNPHNIFPYNKASLDNAYIPPSEHLAQQGLITCRFGRCYILNPKYTNGCSAIDMYGDLNNQTLSVASRIINVRKGDNTPTLRGDAYKGTFGVRCTNPGGAFTIANHETGKGIGTKDHETNMIILTDTISSKLNINARYVPIVSKDRVLIKQSGINHNYKNIIGLSYAYDNFINDDRGKTYDYCLNGNGIESFQIYDDRISKNSIDHVPNRIVRSEVVSSESLSEGWRTFRPINYSDIDMTKGKIVSLKSSDTKVFIQCEYGLKVNEIKEVLSNNDINLTYLGTGDLFDRPSYELLYSPNGYIGCLDRLHTSYSIFGYIVMDIINKRIFLINDSVNCITDAYVQDWFRTNINITDKVILSIDEYKKLMYVSVIKNKYNNNLFDYNNSNFDNGFTISYSFVTKSWISFYNFIPSLSFFIDQLYTIDNRQTAIYKQQSNLKGRFYGQQCDSTIKMLFSRPNEGQHLLKSVIWDSEYIMDGTVDNDKTFDSIVVHTDTQCTEIMPISVNNISKEWHDVSAGSNKRTFFEYNNIWDIVADSNRKILERLKTSTTPIASNLKFDYDWFERSKFINPFFYVILNYKNDNVRASLNINRIMVNTINDYR